MGSAYRDQSKNPNGWGDRDHQFGAVGSPSVGGSTNHFVLVTLVVMVGTGLVGWYDDYRKMKYNDLKDSPASFDWRSSLRLPSSLLPGSFRVKHNGRLDLPSGEPILLA